MKKSTHTLRALCFTSIVMLTGCINVQVTEKVQPDLTMEIEMLYDFSTLYELATSMQGIAQSLEELQDEDSEDVERSVEQEEFLPEEEACENAQQSIARDDSSEWMSFSCEKVNEYTLRIEGKTRTQNDNIQRTTLADGSVQYTYSLRDAEEDWRKKQDSLLDTQEIEDASEDAPFDFTLSIVLPGVITRADVGEQRADDTVVIDLFTLQNHTGPLVIQSVDESSARRVSSKQSGIVTASRARSGYSEVNVSHHTKQQQRICARLDRFASNPLTYERVRARVQKRFGLTCF